MMSLVCAVSTLCCTLIYHARTPSPVPRNSAVSLGVFLLGLKPSSDRQQHNKRCCIFIAHASCPRDWVSWQKKMKGSWHASQGLHRCPCNVESWCPCEIPGWHPFIFFCHYTLVLALLFRYSLVSLKWIMSMPGAAGSCTRTIWLYLHFTCQLTLILILSLLFLLLFLLLSLLQHLHQYIPMATHAWSSK